jgi:hypothetical protein
VNAVMNLPQMAGHFLTSQEGLCSKELVKKFRNDKISKQENINTTRKTCQTKYTPAWTCVTYKTKIYSIESIRRY